MNGNLKYAPFYLTPQVARGALGIGHPKRMIAVPIQRDTKLVDEVKSAAAAREERFKQAQTMTSNCVLPSTVQRHEMSAPEREDDTRKYANSKEPCVRCGTRGDLGCRHQRPFTAGAL